MLYLSAFDHWQYDETDNWIWNTLTYSPLEMCSFKPDVRVNVDSVIDANADVDLNPRPLEMESSAHLSA